jgi:hypothetical protein
MARCIILLFVISIFGCRTSGYDRIPTTAVDNPDPLLGGIAKPLAGADSAVTANPTNSANPARAADSSGVPAAPTAQRNVAQPDRIGPLAAALPPKATLEPTTSNGTTPGTAVLTLGVKEPQPEANQTISPAGSVIPASNPEVVQGYRKQLNEKGAIGLRTKELEGTKWEAIAHFPTADQPNHLRRIEAQGATEAEALSAIIEQLEKRK